MDQASLVEDRVGDARKFLEALDETLPVSVAFWAMEDDDDRWWFYVASDAVNHGNLDRGYLKVVRALAKSDAPSIEPLRVKLLPGDDPIARAALDVLAGHPTARRRLHLNRQLGPLYLSRLVFPTVKPSVE